MRMRINHSKKKEKLKVKEDSLYVGTNVEKNKIAFVPLIRSIYRID